MTGDDPACELVAQRGIGDAPERTGMRGIALVNMAHVVGLTLMESVRYRGGFAKLFRYLSLIGTQLAVVANFVLLVS